MSEQTVAANHAEGKQPDRVAFIPVSQIRVNEVALRPVKKESVEYQNLSDSVKKRGILVPILVREFQNPDKKDESLYGLIDGLQRYTSACDNGLTEIPAKITDMNQAEIEETQMVANCQKIETKYIQYADQIGRLLARNPTLTMAELASRLSVSVEWLYKVLGMAKKLHDEIKPLVDEHRIKLSNAIEISKLPLEEQPQWVDKAMTMDVGEFTNNVAARMKQIKEQRKQGKAEGPPQWEPVPHGRKWAEIKAEYQNGAPNLISAARAANVTDAESALKFAVAWFAHMDPSSQEQQRIKHEADEVERKAEADKRKLEREKVKEAEAKKTREELEKKVAAQKQQTAAPAA